MTKVTQLIRGWLYLCLTPSKLFVYYIILIFVHLPKVESELYNVLRVLLVLTIRDLSWGKFDSRICGKD